MEKFCKDLKEHVRKIINHEKKEIIPLTSKEKRFNTDDVNKKYHKIRDHSHYTGIYRATAHDVSNLRCKTPK